MIRITVQDITKGRILPDTFKVLLARGKKRQPENLYIEIYMQGVAMYKNLRLRCNLQSYNARQSNLCDLQRKAKHEAKAIWPHVTVAGLKIGRIFVDHRIQQSALKRLPLNDSWFLFNSVDDEVVLYLWGKRFALQLTSQPKYVGTRFINYRTGEPELGIDPTDEAFADALITKIREEKDESIADAVEMYLKFYGDGHSISVDAFMNILEIHWTYWIELEDGTHNYKTMSGYIRGEIERILKSPK